MARAQTVEVREQVDLFMWARQEAQRVAEQLKVLAARIEAANDATLTLSCTAEQAQLDEARANLKNARKAALEEDLQVAEAAEAVKAARKRLKGLAAAQDAKRLKSEAREIEQSVLQRERDLALALARGEAPSRAQAS